VLKRTSQIHTIKTLLLSHRLYLRAGLRCAEVSDEVTDGVRLGGGAGFDSEFGEGFSLGFTGGRQTGTSSVERGAVHHSSRAAGTLREIPEDKTVCGRFCTR